MAQYCTMTTIRILDKLRSGEWVPSLDTGTVYSTMKKGNLAFTPTKDGYRIQGGIHLSHVIWIAANGAIPHDMQIDHINGDKLDNRLCNLRLVSCSENVIMSISKVTYAQAEEIRRKYAEEGTSTRILAEEYKVDKGVIQRIVSNKTYTKPVDTSNISEETRKALLEHYKSGRNIDAIRKHFKLQMSAVRQTLEEELSKEAKMRNNEAEALAEQTEVRL